MAQRVLGSFRVTFLVESWAETGLSNFVQNIAKKKTKGGFMQKIQGKNTAGIKRYKNIKIFTFLKIINVF